MIHQVCLLLSVLAHSAALSVSRGRTVVDWGSVEQQARLESLKPLIYVHVPKSGTTFLNVFAEHPGICPTSQGPLTQEWLDEFGDLADVRWRYASMNYTSCPGGLARTPYFNKATEHAGLGAFPKEIIKGHATIMLRQPEARLLSAFEFNASFIPDWPTHRFHYQLTRGPAPPTFKEYAEAMQGGAVKILTRSDDVPGPDMRSWSIPTKDERDEALRMLKEDFAFVGITERWDLSICLFHAMYGGSCTSSEFDRLRSNDQQSDASLADLNGWRDVNDGALYEEGMHIFNKNLERYGVSEANCPSSCRSNAI